MHVQRRWMRICYLAVAVGFLACPSFAMTPAVDFMSDPKLLCLRHPAGTLISSGTVASTDSVYLYEAAFDPLTWAGSLKKRKAAFDVEHARAERTAIEWDAAAILDNTDYRARRIYTAVVADDGAFATRRFVWDQLSNGQKLSLNATDQLGEARLDYLRGDRSQESGRSGGVFRPRSHVLGDILNSKPVFVAAPSAAMQARGYAAFRDLNRNRKPTVFVGANDGMLHAFDAGSGAELFAYVPNALYPGLARLTRRDEVHRSHVDGRIAVAEAMVGTRWQSVLVAGMGGGAQGIFALDVTDPENFGAGQGALWEFTDADDPDIGNVIGMPSIAKFRMKTVKGVPEYRYFAVVAGGPNHDVNDGHGRFNSAAPNVLFLLALDKPASERWIAGVNYFKFSMPSTDANLISGLAEVKLIAGDDGAASRAYAADLQGNVWRIDFNGTAPWPNALGGTAPKPFFTAMDDSGNRQPISQSLNVVFAPGGYLVLFGTGKLLEAKDLDAREFKPQSFYGVLDLAAERGTTIKRHQLARRIPAPGGTDRNVLRISGNAVRYGAGDKGWYFDFIDSSRTGERSILAAQIADGSVLFNTVIPGTDPCQPSTGRVYFVDTLNGLPLNAYLAGYLSTMNTTTVPMLLPARPDDIIPRDATGKIRTRKRIVVPDPVTGDLSGDAGQTKNPAVEHTTTAGRLSWREIVNWAELHTSVK